MKLALVVALAACGDGPGASGGPARGRSTSLETLEQQMCECRDTACANRVNAELAAWSRRIAPYAPKPDPIVAARHMRAYNLCMSNAVGSAR